MSVLLGAIKKGELTPVQKRRILTDIIQRKVGYDVDVFVGRPLSFYNWDYLVKLLKEIKIENEETEED